MSNLRPDPSLVLTGLTLVLLAFVPTLPAALAFMACVGLYGFRTFAGVETNRRALDVLTTEIETLSNEVTRIKNRLGR